LSAILLELEKTAGQTLVNLIRSINPGVIQTAEDFVSLAGSDGSRSGEEYLGYKTVRSIVASRLAEIFLEVVCGGDEENKDIED